MSVVKAEDFEMKRPAYADEMVADGFPDPGLEGTFYTDMPMPACCFLCGEKLVVPFVFWHGNEPEHRNIGLHPRCAGQLGFALYRDYDEVTRGREKAQARYHLWSDRLFPARDE